MAGDEAHQIVVIARRHAAMAVGGEKDARGLSSVVTDVRIHRSIATKQPVEIKSHEVFTDARVENARGLVPYPQVVSLH